MSPDELRQGPIVVTAYDWVPAFAQGYVRDLRLRWALEEADLPYRVELVAQGKQREPSNLRRQPFGQVPAMMVGERTMFESGACVWWIAETSEALLPADEATRDACFCWLFGALDSVEEPINMLAVLRLFAKDRQAAERMEPEIADLLSERLRRLADALGDRSHLVAERFTVADLMMVFVLRNVVETGDLDTFPTLKAYVALHTARPAFQRALASQMEPFQANAERYEAKAS